MNLITDEPTSDDHLNRSQFASGLASLTINSPINSSFRLGLYGNWGEGKTSVLKMMEKDLRKAGHYSLLFVPWTAKTEQEILEKLLESIAEELNISKRFLARLGDTATTLVSDTWKSISDLDWKLRATEKLMDKVTAGATGRLAAR